MRRAALWLWLCALALRLQPALPQIVAVNVPPEDQDGSGDDSDNFSGSGTAGEKPEEGEPVLHVEAEPGFTARDKEKEVTTRPRETVQLPITQRASTVRVTTAQAAVTSHPHGGMQPGLHETSAPTAPGQPDHQPPRVEGGGTSVIKEVVEDGTANQLP
ncbi:syndecan 1, isoform CRA_b, partial [Mus musculus]